MGVMGSGCGVHGVKGWDGGGQGVVESRAGEVKVWWGSRRWWGSRAFSQVKQVGVVA